MSSTFHADLAFHKKASKPKPAVKDIDKSIYSPFSSSASSQNCPARKGSAKKQKKEGSSFLVAASSQHYGPGSEDTNATSSDSGTAAGSRVNTASASGKPPHPASKAIGTKPFPAWIVKDDLTDSYNHYQSIGFHEPYQHLTFEELRLANHKQDKMSTKDSAESRSFFGLPTPATTPVPVGETTANTAPSSAFGASRPSAVSMPNCNVSTQLNSTTDETSSSSSISKTSASGTQPFGSTSTNSIFNALPAFKFDKTCLTYHIQKQEQCSSTVSKPKSKRAVLTKTSKTDPLSSVLPASQSKRVTSDFKFNEPSESSSSAETFTKPAANTQALKANTANKTLKFNGPLQPESAKPAASSSPLFGSVPKKPPQKTAKMPSTQKKTMSTAEKERQQYLQLHHTRDSKTSGADEQLRTTPLLSLAVKSAAEARNSNIAFPQYGFLGCRIPSPERDATDEDEDDLPEPVLLNTNTPWSAFICGSQGSGKSYTLAAILENCLYPSPKLGKLPKPLAGIVFHNNTRSAENVCEAAHLVSLGVKVNVYVSRSNYYALNDIYKKAVGKNANLQVLPLVLQSQHLSAERMYRLMAFSEGESTVPLYMEVIMRVLREMAMTPNRFNYKTFKTNLDNEGLQPGQKVMMDIRLNLLESFLDMESINRGSKYRKADIFVAEPGTLTIVDLSDPFLDSATTCTLFDIVLSLFEQNRPAAGMLVALDEAHKFMHQTAAAETFTEHLLTTIREQRHNATRVVIATQEPTISPKLLDLCSMTFVHRFSSPDWLSALRGHLAGASDLVVKAKEENGIGELFERIINLDVGESLLFAPSAVLEVKDGKHKKLGTKAVRFKTRVRLGADGGRSMLAIRQQEDSTDGESFDECDVEDSTDNEEKESEASDEEDESEDDDSESDD